MREAVKELFREMVDIGAGERARMYAERGIAADVVAEVESLIAADGEGEKSLTAAVGAMAVAFLERREGTQCGPYRLGRLLGTGGMSAVYWGERTDGEVRQEVAVKLLRAGLETAKRRERFLRERQVLAVLQHPNIAHLIDAGHTVAAEPYLVMEYVDGRPVDEAARGMEEREALGLFLQVCDGVGHAHRRLVVHRDLKPSNILVDGAGRVKILDFGIAKLLEEEGGEATLTVERMLTPGYASPEQVRGEGQTTATDVYSLGAVLGKILTLGERGDLAAIASKAMRAEPEERYRSVEAMGDDVRAYLEGRPVAARAGNAWYVGRKWARRYWVPAAAAVLTVCGLTGGMVLANRERAVAERRFGQVRHLANRVLELDKKISGLPGSTQARMQIVEISKEYLESLARDVEGEAGLALEVGKAYGALARVQGVPSTANLGRHEEAKASLAAADGLLDRAIGADPGNADALVSSAEVAMDRMILADTERDWEAMSRWARKASERVAGFQARGGGDRQATARAATICVNLALGHKNRHDYEAAIREAERAVEIADSTGIEGAVQTNAQSLIADAKRFSGDLEGALAAAGRAKALLRRTKFSKETVRRSTEFNVLWRVGMILGQPDGVSLGRKEEALQELGEAFRIVSEWAGKDPNDASPRILMASAAREYAKLLRDVDPEGGLRAYDAAIGRLREVQKNGKARRGEAALLAGSSYVLRRMGRNAEAWGRIGEAGRMLEGIGELPAAKLDADSEAAGVLRARADFLAGAGRFGEAAAGYEELIGKVLAGKPETAKDFADAMRLAGLYAGMAHWQERAGQLQAAAAARREMEAVSVPWEKRLPGTRAVRERVVAYYRH